MVKKKVPKYIKESKKSALERFKEQHPELEIAKVKVYYRGDGLYETEITTKPHTFTYGDNWDEV